MMVPAFIMMVPAFMCLRIASPLPSKIQPPMKKAQKKKPRPATRLP
jgi:hypothetical protein